MADMSPTPSEIFDAEQSRNVDQAIAVINGTMRQVIEWDGSVVKEVLELKQEKRALRRTAADQQRERLDLAYNREDPDARVYGWLNEVPRSPLEALSVASSQCDRVEATSMSQAVDKDAHAHSLGMAKNEQAVKASSEHDNHNAQKNDKPSPNVQLALLVEPQAVGASIDGAVQGRSAQHTLNDNNTAQAAPGTKHDIKHPAFDHAQLEAGSPSIEPANGTTSKVQHPINQSSVDPIDSKTTGDAILKKEDKSPAPAPVHKALSSVERKPISPMSPHSGPFPLEADLENIRRYNRAMDRLNAGPAEAGPSRLEQEQNSAAACLTGNKEARAAQADLATNALPANNAAVGEIPDLDVSAVHPPEELFPPAQAETTHSHLDNNVHGQASLGSQAPTEFIPNAIPPEEYRSTLHAIRAGIRGRRDFQETLTTAMVAHRNISVDRIARYREYKRNLIVPYSLSEEEHEDLSRFVWFMETVDYFQATQRMRDLAYSASMGMLWTYKMHPYSAEAWLDGGERPSPEVFPGDFVLLADLSAKKRR
ncbi:uncharacterized protein B0I36DRAFT_369270 [Microdochium trichocladiopsis]|uniref:Uncharacterized protein n=1 Tax=Microdochium trichocladiopsis TaxID=1682393 RepID=A0A9P8XTZ2_9PEZI|nr:uncharacterized protein B0I36DRAFT_369270 [Microdochium trichocladiopsis]KAH7014299.1 hypothetical protein B0I36DRAFT_369270 [Microdochium trichocladiopsis]